MLPPVCSCRAGQTLFSLLITEKRLKGEHGSLSRRVQPYQTEKKKNSKASDFKVLFFFFYVNTSRVVGNYYHGDAVKRLPDKDTEQVRRVQNVNSPFVVPERRLRRRLSSTGRNKQQAVTQTLRGSVEGQESRQDQSLADMTVQLAPALGALAGCVATRRFGGSVPIQDCEGSPVVLRIPTTVQQEANREL